MFRPANGHCQVLHTFGLATALGFVQIVFPLSFEMVPPLSVQAFTETRSLGSIRKLFDLLLLMPVVSGSAFDLLDLTVAANAGFSMAPLASVFDSANAPLAISPIVAKTTNAAHNMGEGFILLSRRAPVRAILSLSPRDAKAETTRRLRRSEAELGFSDVGPERAYQRRRVL